MQHKFSGRLITVLICLCLIFSVFPGRVPVAGAHESSDSFFTSFEKNDPLPHWRTGVEKTKTGRLLGAGIAPTVSSNLTAMAVRTAAGPKGLYASPDAGGWSGKRVLIYSGKVTGGKGSYTYNKLYSVNIPVHRDTRLSYMIAPITGSANPAGQTSSAVMIDLAFSDGTYLHQMKAAVDEDGIRMSAAAQGRSGTLLANQWNHKVADIGQVAAGKKIVRILIAYVAPKGTSTFRGAVDDLQIRRVESSASRTPADRVDIRRGTASDRSLPRGDSVPAVGVPNGFAYWSPALDSRSAAHFYPYRKNNNPANLPEIQSFSLGHSPNVANSDRQSLQVMPSDFKGTPTADRLNRGIAFRRSDEEARPYRYRVSFINGISTELTAMSHSAVLQFTFKGKSSNLIFDNLDNSGRLNLHPDKQSIDGYTDARNQTTGEMSRLYFYGSVDRPVTASSRLYGEKRDHMTSFYKFDTSKEKKVTLRIGLSLISLKQAQKNLDLEIGKRSVNKVAEQAKRLWNNRLSKVTVAGASDTQLATLYTGLYRLFLRPNAVAENIGTAKKTDYRYADLTSSSQVENKPDRTGAPIKKGRQYSGGRFADTFQTVWPAYTLLEPKLTGEMINSFLNGQAIAEADRTAAGIAFANAWLSGASDIRTDKLYRFLLEDASAPQPVATSSENIAKLESQLLQRTRDAVLGQLASSLKETAPADKNGSYADDSTYFLRRSENYVALFNRTDGLFGQSANGSKNPANANPRTQTPRWNLAFTMSEDGQGLANLYGGTRAFAKKLNQYLSAHPTAAMLKSDSSARTAAFARIGMLDPGMPALLCAPYMYLYAQQPWKTQRIVREMINRLYTGGDIGQGYLGRDSGASLSAFYLFAAAGFFPLQKSTGTVALAAPYFREMTIRLAGNRRLVIRAPGIDNAHRYVQKVTLNGRTLSSTSIPLSELMQGGLLRFEMGSKPSRWGVSGPPTSIVPSSTDGSQLSPYPYSDLLQSVKNTTLTVNHASNAKSLTDGNPNTAVSFTNSRPRLQIAFPSAERVAQYTLSSAVGNRQSDPQSWILYGSNDKKQWEPLDQRSDQRFDWGGMTRAFSIKNPRAYRYYRLDISDSRSGGLTTVASFGLLGYSGLSGGFNTMRRELIDRFEKNELSETETAGLSYALNQAQMMYKNGNLSSAVYYLQMYVQLLNSSTFAGNAPGRLKSDAQAMINLISN